MWAAALSRSGKRCTRVSRGDARGGHACGSRRSRQVSRPRRASRASHAPVSARVVVLTVAGGSTGLVVYCTTHLPQGRPRQGAPVAQGVPLALGRRQVERLPHTRRVLGCGWLCGAHRACAAAATTKHLHARARTKTRGNPDRGTRVPATKSCGLPRWQCVCIAVGAAAQVRMRATARCKYKIVSDISCDSAHVQQQHDTS
jgi:hypothetical protein